MREMMSPSAKTSLTSTAKNSSSRARDFAAASAILLSSSDSSTVVKRAAFAIVALLGVAALTVAFIKWCFVPRRARVNVDAVLEDYRREQSAYYATSELWDDGILDPIDTRNALGLCLSASLNAPIDDPHYGVFRL